jgi:hypothetical protein
MDLLERMDHLVHITRLDRLQTPPRPRSLRWLPLLALGALAIGYPLMVTSGRMLVGRQIDWLPWLAIGATLFLVGCIAANFLRLFGPRLQGALDEREAVVKARAQALAGQIFAWGTIAACFYLSIAVALGGWQPRGPIEWSQLGLGLQSGYLLLPTLIASWMQPRETPDE